MNKDKVTIEDENKYTGNSGKKTRWNLKRIGLAVGVLVVLVGAASFITLKDNSPESVVEAEDFSTARVSISEDGFYPQTMRVSPNTAVTWLNEDEVPHSISSTADENLNSSESFGSQDSYGYTFTETGTYEYFDPVDKNVFKGMVIVE